MKKIYANCKNFIAKLFRKKKTEYVYMFVLDSMITVRGKEFLSKKMETDSAYAGYGAKEEQQREQLRRLIITMIEKNVQSKGKEIKHTDFLMDNKEYKTLYIFSTDSIKTNLHLTPLMLEIYAFKKIKKDNIFSYPFEELLFKGMDTEVKIYKFKVEC